MFWPVIENEANIYQTKYEEGRKANENETRWHELSPEGRGKLAAELRDIIEDNQERCASLQKLINLKLTQAPIDDVHVFRAFQTAKLLIPATHLEAIRAVAQPEVESINALRKLNPTLLMTKRSKS